MANRNRKTDRVSTKGKPAKDRVLRLAQAELPRPDEKHLAAIVKLRTALIDMINAFGKITPDKPTGYGEHFHKAWMENGGRVYFNVSNALEDAMNAADSLITHISRRMNKPVA